jgi:hypothetical protein
MCVRPSTTLNRDWSDPMLTAILLLLAFVIFIAFAGLTAKCDAL